MVNVALRREVTGEFVVGRVRTVGGVMRVQQREQMLEIPLGWMQDAGLQTRDDALSAAHEATPRYLNYRKTSIYGGTNEVQRTIIASTMLGL